MFRESTYTTSMDRRSFGQRQVAHIICEALPVVRREFVCRVDSVVAHVKQHQVKFIGERSARGLGRACAAWPPWAPCPGAARRRLEGCAGARVDLFLPHPAPVPSEPEAWANVTLECREGEGPDVVKNGTCVFDGQVRALRGNNPAEAYESACSRRVEPSCGKYADAGGWDAAGAVPRNLTSALQRQKRCERATRLDAQDGAATRKTRRGDRASAPVKRALLERRCFERAAHKTTMAHQRTTLLDDGSPGSDAWIPKTPWHELRTVIGREGPVEAPVNSLRDPRTPWTTRAPRARLWRPPGKASHAGPAGDGGGALWR